VWRPLRLAVTAGALLVLAACGPTARQEVAPLEVFPEGFDGAGLRLRNGGTVTVGQGLTTEVFLDPFPATGQTVWIDLYVQRQGQPVGGAIVSADNEMAYMTHGSSRQDGSDSGGGHYQLLLHYPMAGAWRHRISIQLAEQRYELPLVVTVYP
jgi:YtkA-like protein